MSRWPATLASFALAAAQAREGHATVLRVPEDYPSVLAAVDSAGPGDSVLVGPGIWTDKESRVVLEQGFPTTVTACAFPLHGMTIVGTAGAEKTVLDLGGTGAGFLRVISFYEPGPGKLTVEGLTIRGFDGPGSGHGIRSLLSDGVIVRDSRFEGAGMGIEGIGLRIYGGDHEVRNCVFESIYDPGGAIEAFEAGLQVSGSSFRANEGKCIQVENEFHWGPVVVEDSEFIGNRGRGRGVAIDFVLTRNVTIRRNLFLENAATEFAGGAVRVASADGVIEFNTFVRDSSVVSNSRGGGIWSEGFDGAIRGNTFVGCHAVLGGAAFGCTGGGSISFEGNVIAGSTGGTSCSTSGSPIFPVYQCNVFWMNAGGDVDNDWPPATGPQFFADPLFCNPAELNFQVRKDSPCVTDAFCGQMGAFGVGCVQVSVESMTWGRLKSTYYRPR